MTAPATPSPAATPRWGVQASFIQPRQPAFWLYVVLLAIGGFIFIDQQSIEIQLPHAYALSWVLVILYAIPVALLVYRLDLFEREPKLMLAAALIWGGVIATSLALEANGAWLSILGKVAPSNVAGDWGAAIVGPGVEETLKLMGVVTLFLIASSEFDGVLDGFVYGALIGLGFTVVEDVSYFMNGTVAVLSAGADQTGPVLNSFIVRIVGGGLYSHVLFTGLTGMGFAYLVTSRTSPLARRLLGAGLCIAAGVAAHVVWNSPWMDSVLFTELGKPSAMQWIEYGALKGLPFLLLCGLLVVFATRGEEATFRKIVAAEPDPWIVTEPEIASLRSLLARRSARSAAGRQHGPAGSKLTGRLQAAQIEYAMVRSRVDSLSDPALEAQRGKIHGIRSQLAALPVVVPGVAQAVAAPVAASAAPVPVVAAPVPVVAAPVAVSAPAWNPTHVVPAAGMAAWSAPDPSQPPILGLPAGLDLIVESRAGAWAQVRAINGWRGWVDGRLLIERR